MSAGEWPEPPDEVWVWGKYGKYDETYCDPNEIKQDEFEVPVTKYVRADLVERAELNKLMEENERLLKAVQFYADEKNWMDTPSWDGDPDCITSKAVPVVFQEDVAVCDCGDVARVALTQHKAGL